MDPNRAKVITKLYVRTRRTQRESTRQGSVPTGSVNPGTRTYQLHAYRSCGMYGAARAAKRGQLLRVS
jgi:hypothetical protein